MEEQKTNQQDIACEPALVSNAVETDERDYTFGGVDFGYPRTQEEVETVLDRVETEFDDSTKWTSFGRFMSDFKQDHPAWFR
jgi:FPC/CPF motif-containing protein YcgG